MAPITEKKNTSNILTIRLPRPAAPAGQHHSEQCDRFIPDSPPAFSVPKLAEMQRLCQVERNQQVITQNRPQVLAGKLALERDSAGALSARPLPGAADTFAQFDHYTRSGESARDSGQFLLGEAEGARRSAGELAQVVRHPLQTADKVRQGGGAALLAFSRDSEHMTLEAVKSHLKALAQDDPRQAGNAWGRDLFDLASSAVPLPSARKLVGMAAELKAVAGRPLLKGWASKGCYQMSEGVGRNTMRMRSSRVREAKNYLAEFYAEPKGGIHFHSSPVRSVKNTQYCTLTDSLHITPDALPSKVPASLGTRGANLRVSLKGCLAHEMEGHRRAFIHGKSQPVRVLEEAQASIRAARYGKGLEQMERYTLLRDGISRLAAQGIKIREVKDLLWI